MERTPGNYSNYNYEDYEKFSSCEPGLLLPVWRIRHDLSAGDRLARGLVYLSALMFVFIGVALLTDKLMASIGVITTKKKLIKKEMSNGQLETLSVPVWNKTVANLTLIVIGSFAPQIMLPISDITAGNDFWAGIGSNLIIGSAAFNMFVVTAICTCSIPSGEVRRIKNFCSLLVHGLWSLFAFIWIFLVISVSSPGVLEVWEAVLTLLFFPATVFTVYLVDRRMQTDCETPICGAKVVRGPGEGYDMSSNVAGDGGELHEFQEEMIKAADEPKNRSFYRMQVTRNLFGGRNPTNVGDDDAGIGKGQPDDSQVQTGTWISSWKYQFKNVLVLRSGNNATNRNVGPSWGDYVIHFLAIFWKVIFAFVPPPRIASGYLTFLVTFMGMGFLTAVISDLASHLGCTVGLKDSVTTFTIVTLGLMIAEALTSKAVAIQEKYADPVLDHILGGNAVMVFLGFGMTWTIGTIRHRYYSNCQGSSSYSCGEFYIDSRSLGYSIILLGCCSGVVMVIFLIRRFLPRQGGGELGGKTWSKYLTSVVFVSLWLFYLIMISLESYGVIAGI